MKITKYISVFSKLVTVILVIFLHNYLCELIHPVKIYPDHVDKTLYIDRNFSDEEVEHIISAAMNWTISTNYIVKYNIVLLPISKKINPDNAMIIVKLSPDHPDVLIIDDFDGSNILGFYNDNETIPYIALVPDNISMYSARYKAVILHELGHSLGLKHNKGEDGIGTLMYPSADFGSESITKTDLINFCKLYHCKADKL